MILFKDISQWQGDYTAAIRASTDPAIAIKMSGGDAGLYYDSRASLNYNAAVQSGKVPIGYHFAGGTDPIAEADFFIRAMSPLAENDVLALDWEVSNPDPVGWCQKFVQHVHDVTGVWPLVYMNMSTANAHDWSPVFNNCGYWCAAPSYSFDATLPVKYPQVAQQGPIVNGVDTDAFFGTVEQLKKYGYHAAVQPAPTTTTTTTQAPPPPTTTTTTTEGAEPEPTTTTTTQVAPTTTTTTTENQQTQNIVVNFLVTIFKPLTVLFVAVFNRLRGTK